MGHCAAPCNLAVSEDEYAGRVRHAVAFMRGRGGKILGDIAVARDRAAAAMRFEEANRRHRDLEALATLAERATRLSRVVTENNLVIVLRSGEIGGARDATANQDAAANHDAGANAAAYVVLSGRLALVNELDEPAAAAHTAAFVAANYERYRTRPVVRGELEAMAIVARWLKERGPNDGTLVYLNGGAVDAAAISAAAGIAQA
jgi:hypothetical protein